MTANRFYTIGHSTTPLAEFIDILRHVGVNLLVDVRKIPRSRGNPQYNIDTLPLSLSDFQIGYTPIAALGGRRARQTDVAESVNGFWLNRSFHNYADYAMSAEFRTGLSELRDLGRHRQCAIMCAEAVWWRCHRRIITDYLIAAGDEVYHVLGHDRVEQARMTAGAMPVSNVSLAYPAEASAE